MRPEDAVPAARRAAAAARERGGYGDDLERYGVEPPEHPGLEQLLEWAVIEPDVSQLRSTRRLGAPVTLAKRTLYRALRQYNAQLLAQQSRFNLMLAMHVAQLSDRVTRLEERAGGPPGTDRA